MKRIDNDTAVSNLFTDGNPGLGVPATILPAQWLNVLQEEVIGVVVAAGITPDQTGADTTQLLDAINALILGVVDIMTAGDFAAAVADKILTADLVWGDAAYVTLVESGGAIAIDGDDGWNFKITLDGDHEFSNPSNFKTGQSGTFEITQDATGTRVPTWATNFKNADNIELSTDANAVDLVSYFVRSPTAIVLTGTVKDVA